MSPKRSFIQGKRRTAARFAACCVAGLVAVAVVVPNWAAGADPKLNATFGFQSNAAKSAATGIGSSTGCRASGADRSRTCRHNPRLHKNGHDLPYVLVGSWASGDRVTEMDATRRQASGKLAELLGSSALAERRPAADPRAPAGGGSVARRRSRPRAGEALEAYADGVNAWIAWRAHCRRSTRRSS